MSLALIEESAKEVRRLAIAGSPLAVGDFRLKKLVAPLEQAGAKVPVFAQVAKSISELVNGTEAESASRLLNLSTLLNAILYTQGQSSVQGAFSELEVYPMKCVSTRSTARVIKPLQQALTASGAGRFEVVKSAVERGAFNDLRLIDPAIYALGDNYAELADLVAEKILPAFGEGIAPRLKSSLDLKGKKSDARKLTVLHRVDSVGTAALCKAALEEGAPEVKVAAIECLGQNEENVPLLLEQAKSKNKTVRAAALEALATHDRSDVCKLFEELLKGKGLDALSTSFRLMRNRQVLKSLIKEGERVFELVLKDEDEAVMRYREILQCINGRKDAEVEAFLLHCFSHVDKVIKLKANSKRPLSGEDLVEGVSGLLCDIGTAAAQEAVLTKRSILPVGAFSGVLDTALRTWTPEKVFEEFSPLLAEKKKKSKDRVDDLVHAISSSVDQDEELEELYPTDLAQREKMTISWDRRWLDVGIQANQESVVYSLARPNHPGAVAYLLKAVEDKNRSYEIGSVMAALARCQYPKLTELFVELVSKRTKKAQQYDWGLQQLFSSARHLSPDALPKLDELATKLDEKFVDRFLEAIAPLRTATAPNI